MSIYLIKSGAASLNFWQYTAIKTENADTHWSIVIMRLVFYWTAICFSLPCTTKGKACALLWIVGNNKPKSTNSFDHILFFNEFEFMNPKDKTCCNEADILSLLLFETLNGKSVSVLYIYWGNTIWLATWYVIAWSRQRRVCYSSRWNISKYYILCNSVHQARHWSPSCCIFCKELFPCSGNTLNELFAFAKNDVTSLSCCCIVITDEDILCIATICVRSIFKPTLLFISLNNVAGNLSLFFPHSFLNVFLSRLLLIPVTFPIYRHLFNRFNFPFHL